MLTKPTKICLLFIILISFFSINSASFGYANTNRNKWEVIETSEINYNYNVKSNAVRCKYRLYDSKNVLLKSGDFFNNKENNSNLVILDFQNSDDYNLEIDLYDDIFNLSKYLVVFRVRLESQGNGEVLGISDENPYGKNQEYQKIELNNILEIDKSLKDGFGWSVFTPERTLLTKALSNGSESKLYGLAFSKNTVINTQIYQKFYSYLESEKLCTSYTTGGIFKIIDSNVRDCIQSNMGIQNLSNFEQELEKHCDHIWFPSRNNCIQNKLKNRHRIFQKKISHKIEHIRVSINDAYREIGYFWQESSPQFLWKSNLKQDQIVYSNQAIYGGIEHNGKKYSYNNFTSYSSNGISFAPDISETKALAQTCKNSACKNINLEYFNQGVNSKGKWESWKGWDYLSGGKSCGAASAVMGISVSLSKNNSLKSYVFKDNNLTLKSKKCKRPGMFAVTAADKNCNQSSLEGIRSLVDQFGYKTETYWGGRNSAKTIFNNFIKPNIDKGFPIILSYKKPIGHILLITGYTYNGQLVVHDPYRDIQNNYKKGIYDYSGKGAIYSIYPNSKFQLNYLLAIKPK